MLCPGAVMLPGTSVLQLSRLRLPDVGPAAVSRRILRASWQMPRRPLLFSQQVLGLSMNVLLRPTCLGWYVTSRRRLVFRFESKKPAITGRSASQASRQPAFQSA
jgi:hypothetical protein